MDSSEQERLRIQLLMGQLPFFSKFSEYEKKRITAFNTHLQPFKMGAYLVREGHTDTSFFILLSGTVSVVKSGKSSVLAELQAGDFFGEVSFLTNRPRTTNVIANEPVVVIRVDQELMGRLGAEIREKIKDRILERLVERMDDMNELVGRLSLGGRY